MARQSPSLSWRDIDLRSVLLQALFLTALGLLAYAAFANALANMRAHGIPTDLRFWNQTSGFDVNQSLIAYNAKSTYGQAFYVGLLNTLLVAAIGIVLANVLGFLIGIARLSQNALVKRLATIYVEAVRNVPLLLQLLFWYNAVLSTLPGPRQSLALGSGIFLNVRGLYLPAPVWSPGWTAVAGAAAAGLAAAVAGGIALQRRRQRLGGASGFAVPLAITLLVLPSVVAAWLCADDLHVSIPQLKGFNFSGGVKLVPEFIALLVGLVVYTAAFIAEIVRSGMQSVPKGQTEAAEALGLSPRQIRTYVIIPQAMRLMIPPLTSQYLNLLKNSSLAVFIGYPDLVQVFMGIVLNQTGAAIQIIGLTMLVYLTISLAVSALMSLYNRRMAFGER